MGSFARVLWFDSALAINTAPTILVRHGNEVNSLPDPPFTIAYEQFNGTVVLNRRSYWRARHMFTIVKKEGAMNVVTIDGLRWTPETAHIRMKRVRELTADLRVVLGSRSPAVAELEAYTADIEEKLQDAGVVEVTDEVA